MFTILSSLFMVGLSLSSQQCNIPAINIDSLNLNQFNFNSLQKEYIISKINYINNYNLQNLTNSLINTPYFTNNNDINSAINEYKKYLITILINNLLNNNEYLVPSKTIDIIWHTHILDSISYKKLSYNLFNNLFIHHNPNPNKLHLWPIFHEKYFKITKQLYNLIFNISPPMLYWLNPSDSTSTTNDISLGCQLVTDDQGWTGMGFPIGGTSSVNPISNAALCPSSGATCIELTGDGTATLFDGIDITSLATCQSIDVTYDIKLGTDIYEAQDSFAAVVSCGRSNDVINNYAVGDLTASQERLNELLTTNGCQNADILQIQFTQVADSNTERIYLRNVCITGRQCGISLAPSNIPTNIPSLVPTQIPTGIPSEIPTNMPSLIPTMMPTGIPSINPTNFPSINPTLIPTNNPSLIPTNMPSNNPTLIPTNFPSINPTLIPTNNPSLIPTQMPSNNPTVFPTNNPSLIPTLIPTNNPSLIPTQMPTNNPTIFPTNNPSVTPTELPTMLPTILTITPTQMPSNNPTLIPTNMPSLTPTLIPTNNPTEIPTMIPTEIPTLIPTSNPTEIPTQIPSNNPTLIPTLIPSMNPTKIPTNIPTIITDNPTLIPTLYPTEIPTKIPSTNPTLIPSSNPTEIPTKNPTKNPTSSDSSDDDDSSKPILNPTTTPLNMDQCMYVFAGENINIPGVNGGSSSSDDNYVNINSFMSKTQCINGILTNGPYIARYLPYYGEITLNLYDSHNKCPNYYSNIGKVGEVKLQFNSNGFIQTNAVITDNDYVFKGYHIYAGLCEIPQNTRLTSQNSGDICTLDRNSQCNLNTNNPMNYPCVRTGLDTTSFQVNINELYRKDRIYLVYSAFVCKKDTNQKNNINNNNQWNNFWNNNYNSDDSS